MALNSFETFTCCEENKATQELLTTSKEATHRGGDLFKEEFL